MTNIITRVLENRRERKKRSEKGVKTKVGSKRYCIAGFEDGRRGQEQGMWAASKSWERPGNEFSSRASGKNVVTHDGLLAYRMVQCYQHDRGLQA